MKVIDIIEYDELWAGLWSLACLLLLSLFLYIGISKTDGLTQIIWDLSPRKGPILTMGEALALVLFFGIFLWCLRNGLKAVTASEPCITITNLGLILGSVDDRSAYRIPWCKIKYIAGGARLSPVVIYERKLIKGKERLKCHLFFTYTNWFRHDEIIKQLRCLHKQYKNTDSEYEFVG